jgi:hypothetical protein
MEGLCDEVSEMNEANAYIFAPCEKKKNGGAIANGEESADSQTFQKRKK